MPGEAAGGSRYEDHELSVIFATSRSPWRGGLRARRPGQPALVRSRPSSISSSSAASPSPVRASGDILRDEPHAPVAAPAPRRPARVGRAKAPSIGLRSRLALAGLQPGRDSGLAVADGAVGRLRAGFRLRCRLWFWPRTLFDDLAAGHLAGTHRTDLCHHPHASENVWDQHQDRRPGTPGDRLRTPGTRLAAAPTLRAGRDLDTGDMLTDMSQCLSTGLDRVPGPGHENAKDPANRWDPRTNRWDPHS